MGKQLVFNIGDNVFKTKNDLKNFTKSILNKYSFNSPIDTIDYNFICELLKRHPEYDRKVGSGIKSIVIRPDGHWGKTRCFHIICIDGTETDFSYINCIDNDTSREPLRMFKLSARGAVEGQIITHLSNYIRRTIDGNNNVVCEMEKIRIKREEATVDHIPPLTFDKIVEGFIKMKNIDPSQIEYTGFGDNEYNKQFKDPYIKTQFATYHKTVAKLRVISKHNNLTQNKKNFSKQIEIKF